jgi:hypothetical protein
MTEQQQAGDLILRWMADRGIERLDLQVVCRPVSVDNVPFWAQVLSAGQCVFTDRPAVGEGATLDVALTQAAGEKVTK